MSEQFCDRENGAGVDLRLVFAPRSALNQPPLGIATLKAYLQHHGFSVACEDLSAELFLRDRRAIPEYYYDDSLWYEDTVPKHIPIELNLFLELTANRLASLEQRYLGFSIMVGNVWPTVFLAHRVKELNPRLRVILGGPHCVLNWQDLMQFANADFVVLGDGENPLSHLLEWSGVTASSSVPGLISRGQNSNAKLSMPTAIDESPPPDFSDFPLNLYKFHCNDQREMLPVMRSKGCIFDCPFCSRKVHDDGYRIRGDSGFVREIRFLSDEYNVFDFYFVDSLINPSAQAMDDLAAEIKSARLDFSWRANASTSHFMRRALLDRLRQAGCRRLNYGLESGSATVRRSMRKPDDMDSVSHIIRETHEAGIMVSVWLMVGYPTEGEREFLETVAFVEAHADVIDSVQISTCSIIPGTELQKSPASFGIRHIGLGQNWNSDLSTPSERERRMNLLQSKAVELGLSSARAL